VSFPARYLGVVMVVRDGQKRCSWDPCKVVPQQRQVQGASKVLGV